MLISPSCTLDTCVQVPHCARIVYENVQLLSISLKMSRVFIVVSMGRNGEAELAGLGLAGLNNFSGLRGTGDLSRCLMPGPGVVRTGDKWPA